MTQLFGPVADQFYIFDLRRIDDSLNRIDLFLHGIYADTCHGRQTESHGQKRETPAGPKIQDPFGTVEKRDFLSRPENCKRIQNVSGPTMFLCPESREIELAVFRKKNLHHLPEPGFINSWRRHGSMVA